MRPQSLWSTLLALFLLPALLLAQPTSRPASPDPNALVLDFARGYADGGSYRRDWGKGSGTPDEIRHGGVVILPADTGGTYCCGYTLSVAMRAMNELGLIADKPPAQLKRFQKLWYGSTQEDRQRLMSFAVEDLGVGREVPHDEAKPGDFLQLWRNNQSGHSVVFLGWLLDDDGQRIGVRYRSSQDSTGGIGDKQETFAEFGGKVDPARCFFARLNPSAGPATRPN